MVSSKKQILIAVIVAALLVPVVYFVYPQITGSATLIPADFLEEDGWILDEIKDTEGGQINYYLKDNEKSLIIRTRTFDTETEAMNLFAYDFNLKYTRDPVYFKYKDGAFHTIFFSKFQGKGPWLTLIIREGNTMVEFIYANQREDANWEYSGDYDADILWLTSTAIKTIGE
tara:strand:- start:37 stop:552 length:516 start_codon:yes stop_codon:yes gene_type:complete